MSVKGYRKVVAFCVAAICLTYATVVGVDLTTLQWLSATLMGLFTAFIYGNKKEHDSDDSSSVLSQP